MAKTAEIKIGETTYTFRAFNMREIRELAVLIQDEKIEAIDRSLGIMKIASRRAEPKIEDFDDLEPDGLGELHDIARKLLELAGIPVNENPQTPGSGTGAQ